MKTRQDAINEGLDRLSDFGFTMEHFFSEHGPMVVEAISDLGEIDEITAWVEAYRRHRRHNPPPPPQKPIAGTRTDRFEGALGNYKRSTDWLAFFRNELSHNPWQKTIKLWTPILMPGYFGGLTHGLIRTAYAVRSFPAEGKPSELELDELAHGLAYWAGTYTELPGNPDHHDGRSIRAVRFTGK